MKAIRANTTAAVLLSRRRRRLWPATTARALPSTLAPTVRPVPASRSPLSGHTDQQTDKRTDRQTDRQTVGRAFIDQARVAMSKQPSIYVFISKMST